MVWTKQHMLKIADMSAAEIMTVLEKAKEYLNGIQSVPAKNWGHLRDYTAVNLFFEPSTRTRMSFELAQRRLGMHVLNFDTASSSLIKGETLIDTIETIDAMNVDAIVIRHVKPGTPQLAADHTNAAVINAGEGSHEHPTQALLDLMTIWLKGFDFSKLKVAIVGDILHSRVARSEISALQTMGSQVVLVGPPTLIPGDLIKEGMTSSDNLDEVLQEVDVLYMLRIQKERMAEAFIPDTAQYFKTYGIDQKRLEKTKESCVLMHPGPVNRGVEIAADVVTHPKSLILEQVRNGVALRMALLDLLITHKWGKA